MGYISKLWIKKPTIHSDPFVEILPLGQHHS